jgi:hypothetical protein
MAAETALTANFQARDWEFLVGVVGPTSDAELQDAITKLRNFYEAQGTKPSGSTVVNVDTTEQVPVTLFTRFLQFNAGISQTNNTQPYTRIRAAVLGMNNVADNWILDQIAVIEDGYNTTQGDIRKTGRKSIMMKTYDAA